MEHRAAMNRREFSIALGTLGAAAALGMTPQSRANGLRRPWLGPVVGEGEWKFQAVHDWLVPPSQIQWGDTHGLAQDSKRRIYVAHTVHGKSESANAVVVFDRNGEFLTSWGSEFRGGAHGLDIRREKEGEFLYHCDTRRRLVVKTSLDGETVWQQSFPGEAGVYESADRWCPTNVAFAPDGGFFVGDGYGSSYIFRYDADGRFVRTVASPGNGEGEVSCPHGLWVDYRTDVPTLIVADRRNRRLQRFTLEGEHAEFVSAGIRRPCHFKTRGKHLLVPDLESIITILDGEDNVVAALGDGHPTDLRGKPRDRFVPGKFIHPHDAIWLDNGDILVAEWVPIGRVTLLKRI